MSVLTTSPLKVAPSAAGGVAITNGTSGVYGAWVEVIASTAAPTAIAGATLSGGAYSVEWYDLDLGIGTAGAETSIGTIRFYLFAVGSLGHLTGAILPVPLGGIGSGVRVAVRGRCLGASAGPATIALQYYENLTSDQVATSPQVLTSAPSGTGTASLTPSATPWANSAWVELLASTATGVGLLGLSHAQYTGAGDGVEYDLGTGTAGAETVLTTLRESQLDHRISYTWLPGLVPVLAGTRLAVRMRKAGTSTTAHPVALLYYSHVSALVTVPDVVGMTEAAAETALIAAGLIKGTVTTASDPVVPSGDVIAQSPTAGSSVALGSDVDLVISTGPALVTVPNVVGMTTAAADAALVAVGLVTGTLTTATHPSAPAGTVISQSPTAGSSVTPGSAVALVISLGPLDQSIKPAAIVEVELDGVDNGWTALTLDVLRAPGIVIRRGIDETRPDARVASTGTASFGLNNSASNAAGLLGYYSPHHVNVRDGFALGIRCRISLQSPDLVWRVQFLGRLDAIDPLPGAHGARQVLVTAVDWLDEAARWRLTPAIGEQIDQSWDAVLTAILAQMPVQPAAISLNGGSETWPYALDTSEVSQQTALAEFVKLAHSEYGLIYQRADGTLRAEDRHFRMTTTAAVWTLTDAEFQDLELPSTRDDLLNTVRVTTHPRTVSPVANVVVYDQANVIELAAGETKMLMGSYRDPVTGDPIGATELQPQVVGTDLIANTAADGTGTNVSSSMGVVVEAGQSGVRFDVTNGTGAPAFLTTLRLLGKGIYDHGATVHEATDPASISLHGEHALDYDMPYQVRQDVGQAAAEYILAKYKDPLAQAHSLTVIGRTPELLLQILTRDISDRITLSETVTGADDTYFINAVELTIHAAGHASARYTLTPADDPATLAGYFILDISALDGPDILAPF